jgi:predicted nucleotidyltransferase
MAQVLPPELEEIVSQLRAMGARRIILFGSQARGQARRGSDFDLLVIFHDQRTFKERMRDIYSTGDGRGRRYSGLQSGGV